MANRDDKVISQLKKKLDSRQNSSAEIPNIIENENTVEETSELIASNPIISMPPAETHLNISATLKFYFLYFKQLIPEYRLPVFIYFIFIIIFTWPWVLHFNTAIPAGSEPSTVSLFQLFTAEWTGKSIDKGLSYWHPPYFYPFTGVFAWSEPQPISSLMIWFLAKITGYTSAYNLILVSYLMLAGLAGYTLGRILGTKKFAAIWGGLWLLIGPLSLEQLGVLHLLAIGFPLFCFIFTIKYFQSPRLKFLIPACIFYLLGWGITAQYALFSTILFPVFLLPMLIHFIKERKYRLIKPLHIGAAVLTIMVIAPYLLTQQQYLREMGFERLPSEVRGVLFPDNLYTPAKGHWFLKMTGQNDSINLYSWDLGIVCLLLIFASLFFPSVKGENYQKLLKKGLIFLGISALVLGFGPTLGIGGFSIYGFLAGIVPGLNGIRSPARLSVFTISVIAVFAALAASNIARQIKNPFYQKAMLFITIILFALESWTMPIALSYPNEGIKDHKKIIEWLKKKGTHQPVLELPMSAGSTPAELEIETWAMMRMLIHGQPIVNGYSGNFPVSFEQLKSALRSDPLDKAVRYIEAYGLKHIVLHKHDKDSQKLKAVFSWPIVYEDEKDLIYELNISPAQAPPEIEKTIDKATEFSMPPKEMDVIGIKLSQAAENAYLLKANPESITEFAWKENDRSIARKTIHLRGSVLIDKGQDKVYVLLMHLSSGDGDARFVSAEEAERIRKKR